jgi:hypothetical protein
MKELVKSLASKDIDSVIDAFEKVAKRIDQVEMG